MNEYIVNNKVYIKSKNKSSTIINRYFYSLVVFIILTIILYLIFNKNVLIYQLLKSLLSSFTIASIISYVINIFIKDYKFIDIYKKDNTHIISLIIGLFAINTNTFVLIGAILITLLVKKIFKNINLSSVLYGILIITLYEYFNGSITISMNEIYNLEINKEMIIDYLIGTEYLSPILSIGVFIYLFVKRSIKYSIFITYILTVFIISLVIGIFAHMNIVLPFIILATNSIIFLSVYTLTDYPNTPTINETQAIYGIILGIITIILMYLIYPLAVIITLIIGPLILTKYLDSKSYRIKK